MRIRRQRAFDRFLSFRLARARRVIVVGPNLQTSGRRLPPVACYWWRPAAPADRLSSVAPGPLAPTSNAAGA